VLRKKALRDALLDADLEAEKIIITILRSHSDYDILSEETPQVNTGNAYRWVVDPLDGSFNFQHGNPTYGVSISLLVDNVIELGVIYLPFYNEMFTAIRGRGAWLNEQPIHVSPIADLDDALVHVGDFTKDGDTRENEVRLNDIAHLADAVGRVRMIGTAAIDLAYIACGRADALVVHNALPWDIDMGRLLITEAGGTVEFKTDVAGKSLAICSNTSIHQALLNVILEEKYDAEYGMFFCAIPKSQAEVDMKAASVCAVQ
ncbi:MAG TPA: inositol monophosphatase family protein, partial [Ktedonobacteraceae bacterium]|nr:inositol monophosphatase family protein [Ktedonobacteraceae bacterium]